MCKELNVLIDFSQPITKLKSCFELTVKFMHGDADYFETETWTSRKLTEEFLEKLELLFIMDNEVDYSETEEFLMGKPEHFTVMFPCDTYGNPAALEEFSLVYHAEDGTTYPVVLEWAE